MLLLAATCLYAGFQWTIRVLVYPQFASAAGADFPAYEAAHQRRVSIAVGPLFAFFGLASVLALVRHPGAPSVVAAACFAAILALTAFAAVPQHRRLSTGFDAAVHLRLLAVDAARLAVAKIACIAAAVLAAT